MRKLALDLLYHGAYKMSVFAWYPWNNYSNFFWCLLKRTCFRGGHQFHSVHQELHPLSQIQSAEVEYLHAHTWTHIHVVIQKKICMNKFLFLSDPGRGNIKDASSKRDMHRYLNKCHYHEEKEPYCPNFRLGYIAEQARENFSELCRTVSWSDLKYFNSGETQIWNDLKVF